MSADTPETFEQDPSMSNTPAPVVAPVEPPAVVVPPAPVELKFTFQPKDENGRPLGGVQVVKYTDPATLPDLMAQRYEMVIRQLRKVTRERELGTPEVADDAEKFTGITEFKPRDLTADERVRLSQQLLDPEQAAAARDLLVESAFGAKPQTVADTLNKVQRSMVQQSAVDNYILFVQSTPDYVDSPANRATLTGWMSKRGWAATLTNFNRAFTQLQTAEQVGLLESAPEVHQVVEPPVPAVVPPAPVPVTPEPNPQVPVAAAPGLGQPQAQPQQAKRHSTVPSSLNSTVASTTGLAPVDVNKLTAADLERMPSEEYKKRYNSDPNFRRVTEAVYAEQEKNRKARQGVQV